MKVIVYAPSQGIESALIGAAECAGMKGEAARVPQDMCSELYRDPETIGVVWSSSPTFASMTVKEWRVAGVLGPLFILLDQKGLPANVAAYDRAAVLSAGADDVQPLPIDAQEFSARLQALARRDRGPNDTLIRLPGDVVFDVSTGSISFPGGTVSLSKAESEILSFLASRAGAVVSKEMLMAYLYGGRDEPETKITDVFICKVRKKLTIALGGNDVIQTVWGRGWVFVPEGFTPVMQDSRVRAAG